MFTLFFFLCVSFYVENLRVILLHENFRLVKLSRMRLSLAPFAFPGSLQFKFGDEIFSSRKKEGVNRV